MGILGVYSIAQWVSRKDLWGPCSALRRTCFQQLSGSPEEATKKHIGFGVLGCRVYRFSINPRFRV